MGDFEKENAAASEAIALYARRLLEAFGNVPAVIEALRGKHVHYGTMAGEDGKPCMVRATFEFSDDCADVLKAIATAFDLPRQK